MVSACPCGSGEGKRRASVKRAVERTGEVASSEGRRVGNRANNCGLNLKLEVRTTSIGQPTSRNKFHIVFLIGRHTMSGSWQPEGERISWRRGNERNTESTSFESVVVCGMRLYLIFLLKFSLRLSFGVRVIPTHITVLSAQALTHLHSRGL